MKNQKPKYPASLFWTGVALHILRSFLWLVVSTVLLIIGIKTPWCAWAGLTLLAAVLVIAALLLAWGGEVHSSVFALLKLVVTR